MAQLTDLPTEIILHIVSYLQSHDDIAALAAQSSHLYESCDMRARARFREIHITNNAKHLKSAFAALIDILEQPYLGRYVRHIEYWELFHCREPLLAQVLTALLISVAPEVESMALSQPFLSKFSVPWHTDSIDRKCTKFPLKWLLHQINNNDAFPGARGPKLLRKLRDVYLVNETEDDTSWKQDRVFFMTDLFGFLELFHHLPSIESFGTDELKTSVVGKHGLPFASSNISRIRIEHSLADSMNLARMICLCKQLREFQCPIGARSIGGNLTCRLNSFRIIFQALLVHRRTLEVLDLGVTYIPFESTPVERVPLNLSENREKREQMQLIRTANEMALADRSVQLPDWIWDQAGSLAEFSALKHLNLELQYLLYMARGVGTARDDGYQLVDRLPSQ
ncbi:hypothetical protein BO99DRAFT_434505 [Aspergillus violaceofuscus CBS 115571]|uniref:F-box domain-containing protein n=1 Tax=Aspergillus violaceofuscus (strain CBS 115571) TaxID=1450538 RepID=A0A2V5H8X6_ASPV1|nr:hypothetical protein BO99DRAFT_434505 [Aspergillus violaceofuscus CBS 115571]